MEQLLEHLPAAPASRQQKIGRAALGFLALMAALTVVSRSAASLTVPVVSVESPAPSVLGHTAQGSGTVEALGERPFTVKSGLLVSQVFVRPGQTVSPGDPLFSIDQQVLEQQITAATRDLQKLRLQAASANNEEQKQQAQLAIDRAQADYEATQQEHDTLVKRAEQDLKRASNRWDDYEDFGPGQFVEGEWQPEDTSYEDAYRAARRALEDAKANREKALEQARRALEDASLQHSENFSAQITALDIQEKQEEVKRLQAYQENGGIVTAKEAGAVTKVNVAPGQNTSGEAALLLAAQEDGYFLKATLPKEEAEYLTPGQTVTVTLAGEKTPIEATVQTIAPGAEGGWEVAVTLPAGQGSWGNQGEFKAVQYSKTYNACLPLSAIHEDTSGKYVLTVEERPGILGTEKVAVRIPVTVVDYNSEKAAVEGALYLDSQVIISSKRPIGEGDRVRMGEG